MTSPLVPELLAIDAVERPGDERRAQGSEQCRNCGAPLTGPYCAQCGQFDAPSDPTLRELLADAWDALTSLDGKLAASLRLLLTRPGALTVEYLAGRRARYLAPFRLYLICSVVYFLVAAAVPDEPDDKDRDRARRAERRLVARYGTDTAGARRAVDSLRSAHRADSIAEVAELDSSRRAALASVKRPAGGAALDSAQRAVADSILTEENVVRAIGERPGWLARVTVGRFTRNRARFQERSERDMGADMRRSIPRMMFVLMPVLAAMLAVVYRSRRRRFPSHLVVSLHLHAFAFAALTLLDIVSIIPDHSVRVGSGASGMVMPAQWLHDALTIPLAIWLFVHMPLALRRVYGGRLSWAVLRAAALASVYAMVSLLATVLLVFLLIWSY
jgi:hypothetical protein